VINLFNGSMLWQFLPFLNGVIAAVAEAFLTMRAGAVSTNLSIAVYLSLELTSCAPSSSSQTRRQSSHSTFGRPL